MAARSRSERKAVAVLRAELSVKQAFERIDYDFDVVMPKLEEIRAAEKNNEIDVDPTLELEAGDEVHGLS